MNNNTWCVNYFLVGGAVRDKLLGLDPKDRDYVVIGSTPEQMIAHGFKQVGSSFPVFLHPDTREEYALARTERKTGPGYHGFATDHSREITLYEDLERRDLTINSMAMTDDGVLVDPFNGKQDLKNGVLRHTSLAFADDPVRVLRLARFAARYGFIVAKETVVLAKRIVQSGELSYVPRERIWIELDKGFNEPYPELMIEVLHMVGALDCSPVKEYFGDLDYPPETTYDSKIEGIMALYGLMRNQIESGIDLKLVNIGIGFIYAPTRDKEDYDALRIPKDVQHFLKLKNQLLNLCAASYPFTAETVFDFINQTKFDKLCFTNRYLVDTVLFYFNVVCQRNSEARSNLAKLMFISGVLTGLDLKAVATGDKATIGKRVEQARFAAVSEAFNSFK